VAAFFDASPHLLHEIKARADAGLRCRFPEARLGYAADKLKPENTNLLAGLFMPQAKPTTQRR
jgi:hypothetical protein